MKKGNSKLNRLQQALQKPTYFRDSITLSCSCTLKNVIKDIFNCSKNLHKKKIMCMSSYTVTIGIV